MKYGLSKAGAVCTGTITVMPSMVIALWSDGPAPAAAALVARLRINEPGLRKTATR